MKIHYGPEKIPAFRHAVVTVGSYDGLHGGHALLLGEVRRLAAERGGESVVVTFAPHPRIVLGQAEGLKLLTTPDEKALLLERSGIDHLVVMRFTPEFSRTSPLDFLRRDLVGKIGARTLVVGYNHRFGRDKEGDFAVLERLHDELELEVHRIAKFDVERERVSSTAVRQLIGSGDMARAARILGHPYLVIARRTADVLRTDDPYKLLPPAGRYAVRIDGRTATLRLDADGSMHADLPLASERAEIEF